MARFIRAYGPEAYRGVAWQTPDRVIPVRLFFALWQQLPALRAATVLEGAEGAQLGQLLAENPKHHAVKRAVRRLEKESVPVLDLTTPRSEG